MVVIGLGTDGANMARQFEKWPQYEVITIEAGKEMPLQTSVEDYEKNTPSFSDMFENIDDEVWFFVAGSASIAASSLAILEQIKDKNINH